VQASRPPLFHRLPHMLPDKVVISVVFKDFFPFWMADLDPLVHKCYSFHRRTCTGPSVSDKKLIGQRLPTRRGKRGAPKA
jgi:hypothetical protein